jgi:hypothetical protein
VSARTARREIAGARPACGLLAIALLCALCFLAWHYPPSGSLALVVALGFSALTCAYPYAWAYFLPALLPLIGWAPWTGWFTFEELDLLVLAVATGGYARLALAPLPPAAHVKHASESSRDRLFGVVLMALYVASVVAASVRGLDSADGWSFGWYQGYMEPMNTLRVAKSLFLALILVPLWRSANNNQGWTVGMALGLIGASLSTIWERMAYTGLLNFSTDYRTTALFWEMQVGGAALDGFLALTVPFALRQTLVARTHLQRGLGGAALVLGLYACLTTFSRGVYAAIPVGVAVMLMLQYWQAQRTQDSALFPTVSLNTGRLVSGVFLVACFGIAAAWVFPTSGYRGSFAVAGALGALALLANVLRRARLYAWVGGWVLGCLLASVGIALALMEPKASYLVFAVALLACILIAYQAHQRYLKSELDGKRRRRSGLALLGLASYFLLVTGMVLIMEHWGETPALVDGLPVLAALLFGLAYLGSAKQPVLPRSLQWHGMVAAGMLMALTAVGVISGGNYLSGRFSTVEEDLNGRVSHWQQGLSMLDKDNAWWWGRGMGRYPASYLMEGPHAERVGDYRLLTDNPGPRVLMSGGLHVQTDGKLLRFSQRIAAPVLPVVVTGDIKASAKTGVRFEICPKHLLYTDSNCVSETLETQADAQQWQHFELPLRGNRPTRGDWFAPKFIVFSTAVVGQGQVVEMRDLHLRDGRGNEALANGDFSEGLRHWFISSDHNHLPWHIKNLLMNVLFEQGLLGLLVFLALTATALWRVTTGSARNHPLAPAIAGAIVGFQAVGFFDSLLDVPRVSLLYYFMVALALLMRPVQDRSTHRQLIN